MKRTRFSVCALGTAFIAASSACTAPDFASPCPVPPGATAEQIRAAKQTCYSATPGPSWRFSVCS